MEFDEANKYFWQGEKVRLRPVSTVDAERCYRDSFDSPTRQTLQLGIELPSSIEQQQEALAKYAGCREVNGVTIFAIENRQGDVVGGISLHSKNRKNGTFALGLVVAEPYRRKGYAEEASRILMRYCFHERRYQKCNSACVHTNEASIALHKAVGFVEEGRRRRNLFFNGRYYDDILFGMTREEFNEREQMRQ